jgi:hypothetical protein
LTLDNKKIFPVMCLPSNKKKIGFDSKIEKLCWGAERKAKKRI